jgi:hypothetical protein
MSILRISSIGGILLLFLGCTAHIEQDTDSTWCVGVCTHTKTRTIEDTEKAIPKIEGE